MTALAQASYSTLMFDAYDQMLSAEVLPIIARANLLLLVSGPYFLAATTNGEMIGSGGWSREQPVTQEL